MKRSIVKFLTIGVIGAGLALAQRQAPDPATMAQHQVERLTQALTLTSSQQSQANTIFTAEATANQSVMASMQQARTALETAIKANDAGGIGTAANTIGTLTAQMTTNNAKAQAAFYAILTADQQAKYHVGAGGPGFGGRMRGQGRPQQ
jgi:Spy/CpxP family protein refolding chaperone